MRFFTYTFPVIWLFIPINIFYFRLPEVLWIINYNPPFLLKHRKIALIFSDDAEKTYKLNSKLTNWQTDDGLLLMFESEGLSGAKNNKMESSRWKMGEKDKNW